jgi:tetratricopeptide (TPR) repeat protein
MTQPLRARLTLSAGLLLAAGCLSRQVVPNTEPMSGGDPTHADYQRIDEEFIATVMKKFQTRTEAADYFAARGWDYLRQAGDCETAMKRFNQCWLLDPQNGNCFWGFGVLEAERGNSGKAVEYLERARALLPKTSEVRADLATAHGIQGKRTEDPIAKAAAFDKAERLLAEAEALGLAPAHLPCLRATLRRDAGRQAEACALAATCTRGGEGLRKMLGCPPQR